MATIPDRDLEGMLEQSRITVSRNAPELSDIRNRLIARIRLLWESRRFLFKVTSYGLIAGIALAFLIPARYESTTQLMPPSDAGPGGLASLLALGGRTEGGLGMLAGDLLGLKTSGALFTGILRSRTVEDHIINQFNLRKIYGYRRMQDARRELERNTSISEDRKSGIITISISDKSPIRASRIAQAYVEQLDFTLTNLNTSAAHRERVFLEGRLTKVKSDLDKAEKDFSEFSSKNAAIDIKEQGRAMVESSALLEGQLIAAQSELEGLKQIYSNENVRVRASQARIRELKQKLQEMGGTAALSNANGATGDNLYPSIRELPLLGVTYSDLYRRAKIQETIYEMLTQECEMAKVQEAKETPSVKVLDEADIPEKRSFPPRISTIIISAIISFAGGVLWLLMCTSWKEMDSQDQGKVLAEEIWVGTKSTLHTIWFRAFHFGGKNSTNESS